MRVLIVSDTHGRYGSFDKALEQAGKIDCLIHLGDTEGGESYMEAVCECPAYILAGNNDFYSDYPREREIQLGNKKVFMTHGHYYRLYMGMECLVQEGKARNADIVMFGHTHKPYLETFGNVTVLNPGSLTLPRQQNRKGSYIIMEMDDKGNTEFTIHYL